MKILILNFAGILGSIGNTQLALKAKFGEENITTINFNNNKLEEMAIDINIYDQIIIAAHGKKDDVNYCYKIDFAKEGENKLEECCNYNQLAAIFIEFLKNCERVFNASLEKTINLVFAICYAARTSEHNKNHVIDIGSIDFTDTFAYKFLDACQHEYSMTLAAYTGAVYFKAQGPHRGKIKVETEEQVLTDKQELERLKALRLEAKNDPAKFEEISLEIRKLRANSGCLEYGKVYFKNLKLERAIQIDTRDILGWPNFKEDLNVAEEIPVDGILPPQSVANIPMLENEEEGCCGCWFIGKNK